MNDNKDQQAQVFTGEGITYYQLATLKQALKLESKGMQMMRGAKKIRPLWAEKLGLKPRDSYEVFIAEVQKRMNEILVKKAAEEAEGQTKH